MVPGIRAFRIQSRASHGDHGRTLAYTLCVSKKWCEKEVSQKPIMQVAMGEKLCRFNPEPEKMKTRQCKVFPFHVIHKSCPLPASDMTGKRVTIADRRGRKKLWCMIGACHDHSNGFHVFWRWRAPADEAYPSTEVSATRATIVCPEFPVMTIAISSWTMMMMMMMMMSWLMRSHDQKALSWRSHFRRSFEFAGIYFECFAPSKKGGVWSDVWVFEQFIQVLEGLCVSSTAVRVHVILRRLSQAFLVVKTSVKLLHRFWYNEWTCKPLAYKGVLDNQPPKLMENTETSRRNMQDSGLIARASTDDGSKQIFNRPASQSHQQMPWSISKIDAFVLPADLKMDACV